MEILSEHTEWLPFIFATVIVSILALLSVGGCIAIIVGGICDGGDIIGLLLTGLFSIGLIAVLIFGIPEGPETYYKATVTDYNVVYDEGYTITDIEGKIVTLTKE